MPEHFGNLFNRHSVPQRKRGAGSSESVRVDMVYSGTLTDFSDGAFNR
jgi:hypothetical protein